MAFNNPYRFDPGNPYGWDPDQRNPLPGPPTPEPGGRRINSTPARPWFNANDWYSKLGQYGIPGEYAGQFEEWGGLPQLGLVARALGLPGGRNLGTAGYSVNVANPFMAYLARRQEQLRNLYGLTMEASDLTGNAAEYGGTIPYAQWLAMQLGKGLLVPATGSTGGTITDPGTGKVYTPSTMSQYYTASPLKMLQDLAERADITADPQAQMDHVLAALSQRAGPAMANVLKNRLNRMASEYTSIGDTGEYNNFYDYALKRLGYSNPPTVPM